MSISGPQCRAARALLGLSQDDVAEASNVAKATIANFEVGKRRPYDRTLDDLRGALEAAGVEFIPENGGGAGVRLRDRSSGADERERDAAAAEWKRLSAERTRAFAAVAAGDHTASPTAEFLARCDAAEERLRMAQAKVVSRGLGSQSSD
jgi:transcriptional regulator with XRE-family HTH domain